MSQASRRAERPAQAYAYIALCIIGRLQLIGPASSGYILIGVLRSVTIEQIPKVAFCILRPTVGKH